MKVRELIRLLEATPDGEAHVTYVHYDAELGESEHEIKLVKFDTASNCVVLQEQEQRT